MLFSSSGRAGEADQIEHLYVVERQGAGWGAARRLRYAGDDREADDGEAQVTPDGATLLFSSARKADDPAAAKSAWNNGKTNVWALPLRATFRANGLERLL